MREAGRLTDLRVPLARHAADGELEAFIEQRPGRRTGERHQQVRAGSRHRVWEPAPTQANRVTAGSTDQRVTRSREEALVFMLFAIQPLMSQISTAFSMDTASCHDKRVGKPKIRLFTSLVGHGCDNAITSMINKNSTIIYLTSWFILPSKATEGADLFINVFLSVVYRDEVPRTSSCVRR